MSKISLHKKAVVVVIITIFFTTSILPSISGIDIEINEKQNIKSKKLVGEKDEVDVTFYSFGLDKQSTNQMQMSYDDVDILIDKISKYSLESAKSPQTNDARILQQEIFTKFDELGISPKDIQVNLFDSIFNRKESGISPVLIPQNRASAFFCNFVTTGTGSQFPIIIFPRLIPIIQLPIPRVFLRWTATEGITSCGGLVNGQGYIAYGQQKGTALGFWGIGFSVFLPPIMQYGFIGYALFASTDADVIELWPPNNPPEISPIDPHNDEINVPLSIGELQFEIYDFDGDLMNYVVTTSPDVGSGSGNVKPDGVYSFPIGGLEYDKIYQWTIEVNDGKDTVQEEFTFFTEAKPPFDPFDEGWQYRKQITIDHAKVDDELNNFPALVSTVDSDLHDKAQNDGDDIMFMDGTGVSTKLYHEIERYDGSSGELIAWVNVLQLSGDADTILYMYYGNSGCNSQQYPERAWDNNYRGVWHCSETSSTIYDSTFCDNDAMPRNGLSQDEIGIVDGANKHDGNDDGARASGSSSSLKITDDVTFEAWGNTTGSLERDYIIYKEGTYCFRLENHKVCMYTYTNDKTLGTTDINSEAWYYMTTVRDGSTNKVYVNGTQEGTYSNSGSMDSNNNPFCIGVKVTEEHSWNGHLDEIRISNIARSNGWISTTYNTINDPSGFMSFGPEVPAS